MRLDRSIGLAPYLLGLLSVLVCVGAGVYLSHWQSMQELQRRGELIASQVLERTHAISEQYRLAFQPLLDPPGRGPCSAAGIEIMRRQAVGAGTLRGIGYVQDDRLLCSSYGHHGAGIPLGPPSYVSRLGSAIRTAVSLPFAGDEDYVFVTQLSSGYSMFFLPAVVLDKVSHDPSIAIGVYGTSSQRSMLRQGAQEIPDSWYATPIGPTGMVSFRDPERLVVMRRSPRFDYTAYAVMPMSLKYREWRDYGLFLVPLSLIAGLAIAALIVVNAMRRNSMLNLLRRALRRKEFFLLYQPVVDLQTGRWVGAEALMRWRGRDGSYIAPDVFIPLAERNALIGALTERAIECYIRDAAGLLAKQQDVDISLNFSSRDLSDPQRVLRLRERLAQAGIRPQQVIVEITERVLVQAEEVRPQIQALRAMGVGIAIDDFGTGYSGLSYLTALELDYLKIDKVFVDTIGTDAATKHVVDHIIEIAHALGLVMVAEGVETQAQADYLREHGVQFAQGWLYARALPWDEFAARLQSQQEASPAV